MAGKIDTNADGENRVGTTLSPHSLHSQHSPVSLSTPASLPSLHFTVAVMFEASGNIRRALEAVAARFPEHTFWIHSIDLKPSYRNRAHGREVERPQPENHSQMDCLEYLRHIEFLESPLDLLIAHPPCTRLSRSGGHVLNKAFLLGDEELLESFRLGVKLYKATVAARAVHVAIENPEFNGYAKAQLSDVIQKRHFVQPWWFGVEQFKQTGWQLKGLPELKETNRLDPPKPGTAEYRAWSSIAMESENRQRQTIRSETHPLVAEAIAEQWLPYVIKQKEREYGYHNVGETR